MRTRTTPFLLVDPTGSQRRSTRKLLFGIFALVTIGFAGESLNPTGPGGTSRTVFWVLNTNDAGPGSLRAAVERANATPNRPTGPDEIAFAIPGEGVQRIRLLTALPAITEAVSIDGGTQPGDSALVTDRRELTAPLIELDGSDALGADGLVVTAAGCTIRGLAIDRFAGDGIRIERGDGIVIAHNRIGGAVGSASGNGGHGISLRNTRQGSIGGTSVGNGNAIRGNGGSGVFVGGSSSTGNAILGNAISDNARLGIELEGYVARDPLDADRGPNEFQNRPRLERVLLLDRVKPGTGVERIEGSLESAASSRYQIDLYVSDAAGGETVAAEGLALPQRREGAQWLAATSVVTGLDGQARFVVDLPETIASRAFVTATATDLFGNTSEFSEPVVSPLVVKSWSNAAGGNWSVAGNWSPAGAPTAADDARIDLAGTYTVTLDVSSTVASLALGAASGTQTLAITAGPTLTLNNASTVGVRGVINQSTGTITGSGNLTIDGQYNWSGGTQSGTGVTNANAGISFSGTGLKDISGRTVIMSSNSTWSGSGQIRIGNGGLLRNAGTFDVQNDASVGSLGGAATVENSGTFRKTAGAGATLIGVTFNNSNVVDLQSGTLNLSAGGTSSGSFGGANATLQFSGGNTYTLNGAVSGVSVTGSGSIVNVNGSYNVPQTTLSNGTFNFNVAGPSISNQLTFSAGTLQGTGTLTISGLTNWSGGTMAGAGITNANGGVSFNSTGLKDISGRTVNVAGASTWTGSGQIRIGGGGVLANSGTLDVQNDVSIGSLGGVATVNNSGTFRKSAGPGTTLVGVTFNNSNTVDLQSGTLNLNGGGTQTGSFGGVSSATVGFGGVHTVSGPITTVAVNVNSGTADFNGSYAAGGTTFSGGTANFNPAATVTAVGPLAVSGGVGNFSSAEAINSSALTLSSGTLQGSDTVTISGLTSWSGGTQSGTGFTNANAGISFSGTGLKDISGRTVIMSSNSTWSGSGQIRIGNGGLLRNAGTFDVQNDVSIGSLGGAATVENSGTFRKTAGAGATLIGVTFNNSNVVDLQSGTLNLSAGGTSSGSFGGANATLQFSGGNTYTLNGAVSGVSVTGSGSIVNVNGSYNVPQTTLSNGTFNFNVAGPSLSNQLTFSAGTLQGTGTLTISGLTNWSGGTMAGAGITNANGGVSFNGTGLKDISGRTVNVAGASTWTGSGQIRIGGGGVLANSGTLDVQNDVSIGSLGGVATVNNSGTFRKSAGPGTTLIGVPMNNTGAVEVLAGTLSYTSGGSLTQSAGSTTLNGGALNSTPVVNIQGGLLTGVGTVTGNVTMAGSTAPGLPLGLLTVAGNHSQTSSGALNIQLGGTSPGVNHDRLTLTGSGVATIAGSLNVSLANAYVPVGGESFTIMSFVSASGTFASTNFPATPAGCWSVRYNPTTVGLEFIVPTPDISGLKHAVDKQTLTWNPPPPQGPAPVYDVMRGLTSQFPVGSGAAETCLASGISATSFSDPSHPATGTSFYYLIRGRNGCLSGTYGRRSNGSERVTAVCP